MMCSMARTRAAAAVAFLVPALAACTGPANGPPEPPPEAEQVALQVSTAPGGARGLPAAERTRLEGEVGELLSRYVEHGFLGDFPREQFLAAFDDFTGNAAAQAASDIQVLTASRVANAESVRPLALDAVLYFLVDEGEPIGATAHVDFEFEAAMPRGRTQVVTLSGRLVLDQQRGRWQVFAFDVEGDDGAPVGDTP